MKERKTRMQMNHDKNPQPCPETENNKNNDSQNLENLKQLGQLELPKPNTSIHTLAIVGQIEGHLVMPPQNKTTKYEHILPQLVAIEQDPNIEGVLIMINTIGGDVEAGLAIAEMIAGLSKPTVSLVLGGGHSIGVPIAVAADYSFIAETATMTIHPIRLTGLVISVPQTYDYLDKMQERVIKFVVRHSKIGEKEFKNLMMQTGELAMDIGTILVGKKAVEVQLIDSIGGLSEALKELQNLIDKQNRREG